MGQFFESVPKIIEAVKTPLGFATLLVLAFSFLAYIYFREASEFTRVLIFVVMACGVLMLSMVVLAAYLPQPTYTQPTYPSTYPTPPAQPPASPDAIRRPATGATV